jgi:hypothetical protein
MEIQTKKAGHFCPASVFKYKLAELLSIRDIACNKICTYRSVVVEIH